MKKNWKKRLVGIILGIGCIAMLGSSALASTALSNFNVDVPKINGSVNTNTTQSKTHTGRSGYIRFDLVGGGKKVDCRLRDDKDGTEGAWANNLKTGDARNLASRASHQVGDRMCVRISNELTTIVDVNCYGQWRADNPA